MTWIFCLYGILSSLFVGVGVVVCLLKIYSLPEKPQVIYCKRKDGVIGVAEKLERRCPILMERYTPPVLWGYNGHIQAHIYGAIGRFFPPQPTGLRYRRTATDGATVTFDVFYPASSSSDHPIVLIVPGIANGSDKAYVRVLVSEVNKLDYTVVVLNHLGAIDNEQLTSRRIFTYGGTDDLQLVMDWVLETWPGKRIVGLGLSMGGNILMKYLGEKPDTKAEEFYWSCNSVSRIQHTEGVAHLDDMRRLYNYYEPDHDVVSSRLGLWTSYFSSCTVCCVHVQAFGAIESYCSARI